MKLLALVIPFVFLALPLMAQEPVLPYSTESVQQFLAKNRAEKTPSIVLYNFDIESG